MSPPRIHLVGGTRPNFVKIAPVRRSLRRAGYDVVLVHTGQHTDVTMSDAIFRDLGMPAPDVMFRPDTSTHATTTASIMVEYERLVSSDRPGLVLVSGDVNGTLAVSLAAAKCGVPIGHIESGLRSNDWTMPEEINRVIVDRVSDLLFAPSHDAVVNLAFEGIRGPQVANVGNVMVDSLLDCPPDMTVLPGSKVYAVLTLHRPSNVDSRESLVRSLDVMDAMLTQCPVVFPVHPRTRKMVEKHGLEHRLEREGLSVRPPVGYCQAKALYESAAYVATDSGGIQEETTVLNVPCLTLRDNTERPVTVTHGTNTVVGCDPAAVRKHAFDILSGRCKQSHQIDGWDGMASERIAATVTQFFECRIPRKAQQLKDSAI